MNETEGTFLTSDGTELFTRSWLVDNPRYEVLLVHGMGEHSTRYANFVIPEFLKNNISVITYDQFGHGKTQGKRGHNPGYKAVLDCIEIVINKANTLFALQMGTRLSAPAEVFIASPEI